MGRVQLFSNPKMDNAGRMSNFSNTGEQIAYFNSLTGRVFDNVRIPQMGEPFVLEMPWYDAIGYNYGRFFTDTGESSSSPWIYFSIADFQGVTESKTRIYYNIDYWESARYQMGATLGRGHVTRSGIPDNAGRKMNPFPPRYTSSVKCGNVAWMRDYCGVAFVHLNESNEDRIYASNTGYDGMTEDDFKDLTWLYRLGVNSNEVIGAWFSPQSFSFSDSQWTPIEAGGNPIGAYCQYKDFRASTSLGGPKFSSGGNPSAPFQDDYASVVMVGSENEILWECGLRDWRRAQGQAPSIGITLVVSPSSAYIRCRVSAKNIVPEEFSGANTDIESLEGMFSIPLSSYTVFNDAYTEYVNTQRQYELEARNLTNERQLASSLSSAGSGAIGGALIGSVIPGVGTAIGALAGGAISAVTSGINYGLSASFNEREQAINDAYYKRQQDSFSAGAFSPSDVSLRRPAWYISYIDDKTKEQYDNAVATAGYYYDADVADMEPWVQTGPLTADVEVLGAIPDLWKAGIKERIRR